MIIAQMRAVGETSSKNINKCYSKQCSYGLERLVTTLTVLQAEGLSDLILFIKGLIPKGHAFSGKNIHMNNNVKRTLTSERRIPLSDGRVLRLPAGTVICIYRPVGGPRGQALATIFLSDWQIAVYGDGRTVQKPTSTAASAHRC